MPDHTSSSARPPARPAPLAAQLHGMEEAPVGDPSVFGAAADLMEQALTEGGGLVQGSA